MTASINYPRHAAEEARRELERAEAFIEGCCDLWAGLTSLFTRAAPPATDDEALTIRRAWLRASA